MSYYYPTGQILFAAAQATKETPALQKAEEDEIIEMAKQYVTDYGLSYDDVSIVRRKNETGLPSILVIAKRPVRPIKRTDLTW